MNQKYRIGLALAVAISAVSLTGCIPVSQESSPASSPANPALQHFYKQRLDWKPCGDQLQCARLSVPMDYSHPENGKTFSLPVAKKITADPAKRIGSLVLNPGGPGGSGVETVKNGGESSFGAHTKAYFDLVGFDPRGVAGSKPALDCEVKDDAEQPASDVAIPLYPRTTEEREAAMASAKHEAQACQSRSAEILPFVGTADAARDMDVLRATLGDEKLTYLGWSYGTYLGTVYSELFPSNVRALVLDGPVDPELDWSAEALHEGKAFQKAVDDYADQCPKYAGNACPGTTPDDIRANIKDLYERVAKQPLKIRGSQQRIDENALHNVITMSMYAPEQQWKGLSSALTSALHGDGTKLAQIGNEQGSGSDEDTDAEQTPGPGDGEEAPRDNSNEALMAVNCLDKPHPREAKPYWDLLDRAYQESGVFGASTVVSALSCKDWPAGPTKPHRVKADGVPPVMVVSSTGDPATPYSGAKSLAAQFPDGMLLTWQGPGHTAYGRTNPCVTDAVDSYFVSLTPLKGGAKTC